MKDSYKDPLSVCRSHMLINKLMESIPPGMYQIHNNMFIKVESESNVPVLDVTMWDKKAVVWFKGPHRPPLPGEPGHWANE